LGIYLFDAILIGKLSPYFSQIQNTMTTSNPFETYFLDLFKFKFAQFNGRARRSEFWYFALFNLIVSMGLGMMDAFLGLGFLSPLYGLIALIPGIAVAVRRLHDTGKSGLWLLISFIPFIGWVILIYFMVQDSQPFDNQYGPNPKRVGMV
jgi:uncharacterized membrane protein YhaH (DUF805 family)